MCRCIHLQERQRSVETVLPPERPTGRVHLPVVGWRRLRGAVREKRDEGISIDTHTHTHTHTLSLSIYISLSLSLSLSLCENGPSRPSHDVGCRLLERGCLA